MKFVVISDTHGKHRALQLPKGDVIIHAGDFCHYGSSDDLHDFLLWYKNLEFDTKILIGGNHDFFAAEESEQFAKLLPKEITYLNDSGFDLNGIKIWGSPVQPDLVGWAFGKERGSAMKVHWDLIPQDTEILITHSPPHGILDKSRSGKSIGCEELTKRLSQLEIKFHIFGHVHASYGTKIIGDTTFINASNIDSTKGLVNKPVAFNFFEPTEMENFRKEFQEILTERESHHINDNHRIEKSWLRMTTFLSRDINQTIELLNTASEDEVLWISEVFEDIAEIVKSTAYIECLEHLVQKYPKANLSYIVHIAKESHTFAVQKNNNSTER